MSKKKIYFQTSPTKFPKQKTTTTIIIQLYIKKKKIIYYIHICVYVLERERTVAEDGAHEGAAEGVAGEPHEADGGAIGSRD